MPTVVARSDIDLENIVLRMSRRFGVAESVVRAYVNEVAATFSNARIRSFVPILVEREIRDILRHAGLGHRELGGDPSHGL